MPLPQPIDDKQIYSIDTLSLDEFEHGLLALSRHFVMGYEDGNRKSWNSAYIIAVERWGERIGLPVAFAVMKLIGVLMRLRPDIEVLDPFIAENKTCVTGDEHALMLMVHYMRRDVTPPARDAVEDLCRGRLDPQVIRAGLSLARRFSCGRQHASGSDPKPQLRVVA